MTTAREAPSTWRGVWAVRLLGVLALAILIAGFVVLVYHLKIVGG